MKFHHVGIACENMDETENFVRSVHKVNYTTDRIYDPVQDAMVCILNVEDGLNIELISGKQVEGILKKKMTLYHTCYETNDMQAAIKQFEEAGAMLISEPKPALLFNNRKVCFLFTPIGIVELLESK
jgi:methylmalonyl-CoA/ethylmalonyl-CoA epimerase